MSPDLCASCCPRASSLVTQHRRLDGQRVSPWRTSGRRLHQIHEVFQDPPDPPEWKRGKGREHRQERAGGRSGVERASAGGKGQGALGCGEREGLDVGV